MTVKALFECQLGKESVFGTAVAGAVRLMGVEDVHFTPLYQTAEYPDYRASLYPAVLSALEKVAGKCVITGVATYEDLPYFLDSLFAIATPSGVGPYTRAYAAPSGAYTARMNTVLWGSGSDVQRLTSGVLSRLQLTGKSGAPIKFHAEFDGKLVDGGSLAGLADRAVNVVMGNHFAVAVDAFGGTVGSTAIASTAFDFDLSVESPNAMKQYLGSVTPGGFEEKRWKGSLKMGLEVNATSRAYLAGIYAATPVLYQRLIQLDANDSTRELKLQFAGYQNKGPDAYTDRDGVATFMLDLNGQYDSGAFANWLKATSVNAVAALS